MLNRELKVLVADDHTMFLDGMVEMISNIPNISIVHTATSGQEVIDYLKEHDIDMLITDLRMKDIDGFELSEMLRKEHPEIKILVVSMHNDPTIINQMLSKGISGYILKNTGKQELISAIDKISNGETFFSEEVKSKFISSKVRKNNAPEEMVKLTTREREVLELIAEEYTTNEMAEKLFISLNTVETHRKNILRKLNVRNSVGIVKKAIELGFIE